MFFPAKLLAEPIFLPIFAPFFTKLDNHPLLILNYLLLIEQVMKDNSWQNFLNKGNQGGPKGKGGKQAGTASTKGNKAAPKQMNRRTQ